MNWKIIKTESEYHSALKRLDEIFDCKKDDPNFDEAELLVLLIEKYEMETEPAYSSRVVNQWLWVGSMICLLAQVSNLYL